MRKARCGQGSLLELQRGGRFDFGLERRCAVHVDDFRVRAHSRCTSCHTAPGLNERSRTQAVESDDRGRKIIAIATVLFSCKGSPAWITPSQHAGSTDFFINVCVRSTHVESKRQRRTKGQSVNALKRPGRDVGPRNPDLSYRCTAVVRLRGSASDRSRTHGARTTETAMTIQ